MNIALEGESPYDNGDLFRYLQRHMSVMKSTLNTGMPSNYFGYNNKAFYTTDGMRFEFYNTSLNNFDSNFHESNLKPCPATHPWKVGNVNGCGGCGSYGLSSNPNNTTKPPCLVFVDVNGDRKPTPDRKSVV